MNASTSNVLKTVTDLIAAPVGSAIRLANGELVQRDVFSDGAHALVSCGKAGFGGMSYHINESPFILNNALPAILLEEAVNREICCDAPCQISGNWLIEVHDHHTCGSGKLEGSVCEPGCGAVPILDLRTIAGWDSLVSSVCYDGTLLESDVVEDAIAAAGNTLNHYMSPDMVRKTVMDALNVLRFPSAEEVERRLILEWHEDQCACKDYDGIDIETCYTRKTSTYAGSMSEPCSWNVEAVLKAAGISQ